VLLCGKPLYSTPADRSFAMLASDRAALLLRHYESYGLCLEPLAFALVCSMLRADPSRRPTLEEVWEDPWVHGWVPQCADVVPAFA
jgi:hypothetical protein